jgi:hypothetical protein
MNPYKFTVIHKLQPVDYETLQAEMESDRIITTLGASVEATFHTGGKANHRNLHV